jgi:Fe-S-cluster containining protein
VIEFAIAEHVRSRFPDRLGSQSRLCVSEAVRVAARIGAEAVEAASSEPDAHPRIACRAGCDHCCHMRVVATVPEIIALRDFLVATMPARDLRELEQRIVAVNEQTQGLTDEEWGLGHHPCPMLVQGKCSAYEMRPLDCRAYNSTDAAACADAAEDYSEWDVPVDIGLMSKYKSAQAGLLQGLAAARRRPHLVELTSALRVAFDDTTSIERWLEGENTFKRAELNDSDPEQRAFLPWVPSDELRAAIWEEPSEPSAG